MDARADMMMASSTSDAADLEKQQQQQQQSPSLHNNTAEDPESRDATKQCDRDNNGGKWGGRRDRSSSRTDDDGHHGHGQEVDGNGQSEDNHDDDHESGLVSRVDPGQPPDGGWVGWSQCIAVHLVIFNTWGWVNSFGSFQAYYTELLGRSPSEVSWIGSINVFLLFFVATFMGRLTDAGYFRLVFLVGSVLLAVGIFMTSLCTQYWQLLLAQGLCLGLAHGCLFCPALAVLSTYFDRRRALALGIAGSGTVSGGLVFPSMARQLIPSIGFPWTVRIIGFVQIAVLVVVNLVVRTRVPPRKTGPLIDWAAFRELEYSLYATATFFNFLGVYFSFFYIASYSRDVLNPPLSYSDSLNLLLVLNGVGVIGRVLLNHVADSVGAVNMYIPTSIITSMLIFCFIAIETPTGLYTWVVFAGIAASGIQGLFPAALAFLTNDPRKQGTRMGMAFTIVSFALLTGPPIAGAIIDSPAGWTGAKAFAGASIAVGCMFLVAVKVVWMRRTGDGWMGRV